MKLKIISILAIATLLLTTLSTIGLIGVINAQDPGPTLDPLSIPKYTNQLVIPPTYIPKMVIDKETGKMTQEYTVYMNEFSEQILPTVDENGDPTGFGQTLVWGYGGEARDTVTGKKLGFFQNSPGATFEATRGVPLRVTYINNITSNHMFAVDPTLHWANPNGMTMPTSDFLPYPDGYELAQTNVPLVTHLHGGEVQSTSDGHPEAWYTSAGLYGPEYSTNDIYPTITPTAGQATFYYPNEQPPTTLWYHDHALGVTRTNVMSGLAGFYLLREKGDPMTAYVPPQKWEIPIVIQDRSFNTDGSMWFPTEGNNPEVHPYWNPEFFGDTIMVNGKVWPNLDVDRGVYRFRLLDGSNARFYTLKFEIVTGETNGIPTYDPTPISFYQIGSDGGYLKAAAGPLEQLSIGPGERADILIDFSSLAPGDKVILTNSADIPFRGEGVTGDESPDPATVGQIMQFTCKNKKGYPAITLPEILNPTLTDPLGEPDVSRALVLMEAMQNDEPVAVLLNGQDWDADTTEEPVLGTTEDWIIINPTADTHPIHLHLVQFQLVGRRSFDVDAFLDDWMEENQWDNEGLDAAPNNLLNPDNPDDYDFDDYWTGDWIVPAANEMAWKDTIQMNPGDVTIIRIRFAPTDGITYDADTLYPFDATEGPGYVWHCHILDHEDNEMMRPYKVIAP